MAVALTISIQIVHKDHLHCYRWENSRTKKFTLDEITTCSSLSTSLVLGGLQHNREPAICLTCLFWSQAPLSKTKNLLKYTSLMLRRICKKRIWRGQKLLSTRQGTHWRSAQRNRSRAGLSPWHHKSQLHYPSPSFPARMRYPWILHECSDKYKLLWYTLWDWLALVSVSLQKRCVAIRWSWLYTNDNLDLRGEEDYIAICDYDREISLLTQADGESSGNRLQCYRITSRQDMV